MDTRNRISTLCMGLRFLASRDIESTVWYLATEASELLPFVEIGLD
jgi:hypothetical protein